MPRSQGFWGTSKTPTMKQQHMINLMETDRLLCAVCYEDLQHENIGDMDPNTWLHARIPWRTDDACSCCHAGHPDAPKVVAHSTAHA